MAEEVKQTMTVRSIIEIAGFPAEHVKETLELVIDKVKKSKQIKILSSKVNDPNPISEKFFSGFVELELVFEDFDSIMGFVLDYMPSSIEIIQPETWTEDTKKLTFFINDLIAKLHNIDAQLKVLKAKNVVMTKELAKLKPKENKPSETKK